MMPLTLIAASDMATNAESSMSLDSLSSTCGRFPVQGVLGTLATIFCLNLPSLQANRPDPNGAKGFGTGSPHQAISDAFP